MLKLYSCNVDSEEVKKIDFKILNKFYNYYKIQYDYPRLKPDKEFEYRLNKTIQIIKKELYTKKMFQILQTFAKHNIFDFYMIHYFMKFL